MEDKSHLSAPSRKRLSATARKILRLGLIKKGETYLDYGCGKGSDVKILEEMGIEARGYDPYYFPNEPEEADLVVMSYVINTIKCPEERAIALKKAWELCKKTMVISTNTKSGGEYRTPIGTHVKTYSFIEFKGFVESVLTFETEKICKDKLLIRRTGRQFRCLSKGEILEEIEKIKAEGYVAPLGAKIKGYCNDFNFRPGIGIDYGDSGEFPGRVRHFRMVAKSPCILNKTGDRLVRCRHIARNGEDMDWAIAAIARRNQILQLKFHCQSQDFLEEFRGCKNFDFLREGVRVYP